MGISAYVCLMDDWALLHAALASIAPVADEIVVVDGAYAWMEPYFTACGRDPTRSDPRVDAVLAAFGSKVRLIRGLWDNEIHKRTAGFEACTHRYVLRADADEVALLDPAALAAFLASGHAVAQALAPVMITPDWFRQRTDGLPETLGILFDRDQVTAAQHLAQLWLILPEAERATLAPLGDGAIAPDPIGFIAHLTHWRPPETAIGRANFYVLNRHRGDGTLPTLADGPPAKGFAPFFHQVPPASWAQLLLSHEIVSGLPEMTGFRLAPAPKGIDPPLQPLYETYLETQSALTQQLAAQGRPILHGERVSIDLTAPGPEAHGNIGLRLSADIIGIRAHLTLILPNPPWSATIEITPRLNGPSATLDIPPHPTPWLRRSLTLVAWCQTYDKIIRLQLVL